MEDLEKNDWELMNPKSIKFYLNNHNNLFCELEVGLVYLDGTTRGMAIGHIEQGFNTNGFVFVSNKLDTEYLYRMTLSGKGVMFFRRKKEQNKYCSFGEKR